eukprot:4351483-Prorocentrum_lima.AAC.1
MHICGSTTHVAKYVYHTSIPGPIPTRDFQSSKQTRNCFQGQEGTLWTYYQYHFSCVEGMASSASYWE